MDSRLVQFIIFTGPVVVLALAIVGLYGCVFALVVVLLGMGMNITVVKANGGKMPVKDYAQFVENGWVDRRYQNTHTHLDETTKYAWLADWVVVPYSRRRTSILSPGDIVMDLGILLLVLALIYDGLIVLSP